MATERTSAPAPRARLPSLGSPSLGLPSLGSPSLGSPSLGSPSLGSPSLGSPSLGSPSLGSPSLGSPSLGSPSLGSPSLGSPGRARAGPAILVGAALLIWPAVLNGYPIVFADTGTYLSQAIEHYLGWDRPPFYSLFMLPLHLTLSLWPVVLVQALLASHTLHLVCRALLPVHTPWILVPLLAGLSVLTWLPWVTSEIMPDVFTPLLVLALCLLSLPSRAAGGGRAGLTRTERIWLVAFEAFMIASQQSNLPLAIVLVVVLAAISRTPGLRWYERLLSHARLVAPLALAIAALVVVNFAGHGRATISPFGNVFLLARIIYDGPGMSVLRRDCPQAGWRLCTELDRFPATSDEFLWSNDSPVVRAGGHKAIAQDADAIIRAALIAEPGQASRAFLANWWEQLGRFASGDGLEPWPDSVTLSILANFPAAELAAYRAARQTRGELFIPRWLVSVHGTVGLAGVALCLLALRRRDHARIFAAAVLISLIAGAAITGGLSTPHDRYQSRLMWLAPCIGVLALLRQRAAPSEEHRLAALGEERRRPA